ncbi:MAG: PLP-dependent aminotransferase family protein, partial [Clostridiaceae bacterium]|nr:PLP-dependent aminotransferase family protein [Clostridiaceae bacterium]
STVSTAEQLVLTEYINSGLYAKHLRRMRKKCSEKLKLLNQTATRFNSRLKIYSSGTGTFVLIEVMSKHKNKKIRNSYLSELWNGFYVFNYANINPEKYEEILEQLI